MLPELRSAIIEESRRKIAEQEGATVVDQLVIEMADQIATFCAEIPELAPHLMRCAGNPFAHDESHMRCCGTVEPQYNCPETVPNDGQPPKK